MAKKILFSILSIFLIQQSFQLLGKLNQIGTDSWISVIIGAWIINMFITGVFAFAGFAFPTQKLLPKSYYKVYNPQWLKRVCKILRIDLFRKFLLATLWRNKTQRKKYFNGTANGISILEEQSMKSEFGHLIPFIIINCVGFYLIANGLVKLGLICILINLFGNLYPILLQRHHRMRIQLIRKRQESSGSIVLSN